MGEEGPGPEPGLGGGMPPGPSAGFGDRRRQGVHGMHPPAGAIPDLPPPRYSSRTPPFPPPHHDPYALRAGAPPSSASSVSSRAKRRPPPRGHEHIALGLYTKPALISRSQTTPTVAEHMHGKATGKSGEWLAGDPFLDACMCTTNCTCRQGHRVMYRSRDDGGSADGGEGRCVQGEIRYVLKDDVGKDYGDHSGCTRKSDSEAEDKKRKDAFQGFKADMLEVLDEKLKELNKAASARSSKAASVRSSKAASARSSKAASARSSKAASARSSKAGSVNSPRPVYAGLGGVDPVWRQKMAGLNMGVPKHVTAPYDGDDDMDDMSMPSIMDIGRGNPYYTKGMPFPSPPRRRRHVGRGIDFDHMLHAHDVQNQNHAPDKNNSQFRTCHPRHSPTPPRRRQPPRPRFSSHDDLSVSPRPRPPVRHDSSSSSS
ncbi:hypothetical protein ACEQ8H_002804 [Pleosporales sp. CAS-2024a]